MSKMTLWLSWAPRTLQNHDTEQQTTSHINHVQETGGEVLHSQCGAGDFVAVLELDRSFLTTFHRFFGCERATACVFSLFRVA